MGLNWHPSDDLLADYGAGALAEGWSLAMASHLAMCADCRADAIALDAIGGAALDSLPAVPMTNSTLDYALAAIQDARQLQPEPPKPSNPNAILPAPLADYLGGDVDAIKWRSIGGNVRQCILPTTDGKASARLLTIPPGAVVPEHTHNGQEIILVLQGSVVDGDAVYGPGGCTAGRCGCDPHARRRAGRRVHLLTGDRRSAEVHWAVAEAGRTRR